MKAHLVKSNAISGQTKTDEFVIITDQTIVERVQNSDGVTWDTKVVDFKQKYGGRLRRTINTDADTATSAELTALSESTLEVDGVNGIKGAQTVSITLEEFVAAVGTTDDKDTGECYLYFRPLDSDVITEYYIVDTIQVVYTFLFT